MRSSYREIIIVPFSKIPEIGKERIGIKGANLGELISMRVPVPNGLVITTDAFNRYFLSNHLYEFIKKELSVVDPADSVKLENVSKRIRNGVLKSKMDAELEKVIMKAYTSLSGFSDSYVAIRSSSNFENQGEGGGVQHSTFLNIKGKEDVVEKVKLCWASLFSPQNLFYILSQGHDILALKMAVIVQRMVQAEASGILFTINPIDNDSSKASIEAVLGLGEVLVEGQVTPDSYLIDKEDGEILEKHIVPQDWMLVRKGRTKRGEDPNIKVKVSNIWRTKQKLENKYMKKLFKVGVVIEDHFGEPQEIEWSYEGGKIWIIQTRPVINLQIEEDSWKKTPTLAALRSKVESSKAREDRVVLSQKQIVEGEKKLKKADARILLSGTGICGGGVSGKVKIVISPKQIGKEDKGIILVTPFITGDYLDKLGGVVAIITDEGGGDSDVVAAIKSLGFPCILNTQIATRVLRSGEFVTVSGDTGEVIAGKTREGLMNAEKFTQKRVQPKIKTGESKKTLEEQMPFVKEGKEQIKTATKVFLNVYDINLVQSMAKINADGVVIFDSEQIMREAGVHPQLALKRRGGKDQIVTAFDLGLFRIARSFEHVPVIYKLSNMLSSDYSNLQGGSEFEVVDIFQTQKR
jgi:pyruvate,water dikinase